MCDLSAVTGLRPTAKLHTQKTSKERREAAWRQDGGDNANLTY